MIWLLIAVYVLGMAIWAVGCGFVLAEEDSRQAAFLGFAWPVFAVAAVMWGSVCGLAWLGRKAAR